MDEMKNHGENAGKGFIAGLESKQDAVNTAAESAAKEASATFADAQGEHSPATDYIEHGENAMLGARNGIQNRAGSVADAAAEAATNASAAFAAAVDPSGGSRAFTSLFNAILDKTDTFCANFRTAINNMLTAMRSAVNGVSLSSGKISVTQMKPVQVPRSVSYTHLDVYKRQALQPIRGISAPFPPGCLPYIQPLSVFPE